MSIFKTGSQRNYMTTYIEIQRALIKRKHVERVFLLVKVFYPKYLIEIKINLVDLFAVIGYNIYVNELSITKEKMYVLGAIIK